jgi:hypothetical protein
VIPNAQKRDVQSSGVAESGAFGISNKDAAHIMTILRDTLYSDKVLAVLREYSANAWDAHREIGKGDLPIKVTMPVTMDPTLAIRDFGPGLSKEDVFQVYTQYGASTKRDSDTAVGMLGIGSKSGFAYSDSFTVTSWHGGVKRIYVAVLDASDKGVINLLHEEPCVDETGVEIRIAVRPQDIWEFQDKARNLYYHFNPRPDINLDIPPLPELHARLKNGALYDERGGGWTAVMGCVPYRINIDQIMGPNNHKNEGAGEYLYDLSGELYFDIGEVQISASREELKYSEKTKKVLISRLNALVEEFITHTIDSLNSGSLSEWEKRLRAQILNRMKLPIPKKYLSLTESSVHVKEDIKTFTINVDKNVTTRVSVGSKTRFVIKDDDRALAGYNLNSYDYLIRPVDGKTIEEVRKELEGIVKKISFDGVPIVNISTISWCPPAKYLRTKSNKKHQVRTFVLKDGAHYHPWSNAWEIEKRDPTPDDVFVILSGFKTEGYSFYTLYSEDKALAQAFDGKMPKIYGYKYTEQKPIKPEDLTGHHYPEWRKTFVKSLLSPKVKSLLDNWRWARCLGTSGWYLESVSNKAQKALQEGLGKDHLLTYLVELQREGYKAAKKGLNGNDSLLSTLNSRLEETPSDATLAVESVKKRYPLLGLSRTGFEVLWGSDSNAWLDYIKAMDLIDTTMGGLHDRSVHDNKRFDQCDLAGEDEHSTEDISSLSGTEDSNPRGEVGPNPGLPDGGEESSDMG